MTEKNETSTEEPKVRGRFQLSKAEFDDIQAEHDGLDLLKVGVPGIGVVVLMPAKRGSQRRFTERMLSEKHKKDAALEELARCSIAWPKVDDLDSEIDSKRKYMAWVELGNHASRLAGLNTEDLEGN